MDDEGNLRSNFNIIESVNWYSYVGNNPVKYTDPTGMWTFQLGTGGTLGGGAGVTGETGIGFSYSKEKVFDFGVYAKKGIGSYFGEIVTFDAVSITGSKADELTDMRGSTVSTGGSGNTQFFILGQKLSIGGEVNVPVEQGKQENTSITVTASLGQGAAYEGHIIYTDTKLWSARESFSKLKEKALSVGEKIFDTVHETLPVP